MNLPENSEQKLKEKRRAHRLFGCLAGCGALVVLVIAVLFIIGWWLLSPGRYIPPEQFIPSYADGFQIVQVDVSDAGISALLQAIESEMMRGREVELPADAPPLLRQLVKLQQQQKSGWLQTIAPRALGFFWRTKAKGKITGCATIHLRKFGGLARLLLYLMARKNKTTYAGKHRIIMVGSTDYLSIVGGTVLFADDVELMRGMLARTDARANTATIPKDLRAIYDAVKPNSDVIAVFKSDKAVLQGHFTQLAELLMGRDYRNSELSKRTDAILLTIAVISNVVGYGVDIKSANKCIGKLIVDTPYASQCSEAIASFLGSWQDALKERGIEFQFSIQPSAKRITVPFAISGIKALLRRHFSTDDTTPIPEMSKSG